MSNFVRNALELLLNVVGVLGPPRVIKDRTGASPYLSRYYIRGAPKMPDGSFPYNESGNPKKEAVFPEGLGIYIHKFHRDDEDSALHNHPWQYSVSFILAGGYSEERRVSKPGEVTDGCGATRVAAPERLVVERFEYRPGSINVITAETFHRVDLLEEDGWSLIIVGKKVSNECEAAVAAGDKNESGKWGFWDRNTKWFIPWRTFLADIRKTDETLA